MSTRTIAKSIGNNDAKSAELATAIRKAWLKAKPEAQSEIRLDFMIGYISGRERISLSDAETIISEGKGASKAHAQSIDRASSAFRYHIVQGASKPSTETHARVSKAHREAAMAFLGEFEGESLNEQINAAIAVLRALKK